jgi:hypothetical protein
MRGLALMMLGIGTILAAAPVRAQTYDPRYPGCLQSCVLGGCKIACDYTSPTPCNASA